MSDYRRFVAYLYEYLNHRKGPNRGFVRVESRNGFCRMDFQLKLSGLPPEFPLTVYGLIRKDRLLHGIPLGELSAGRTGVSGRLVTPSSHVGQSHFSLDDLGGLLLTCGESRIFATQWDDIPIQPEFFSPVIPDAALSAPSEDSTEPSTERLAHADTVTEPSTKRPAHADTVTVPSSKCPDHADMVTEPSSPLSGADHAAPQTQQEEEAVHIASADSIPEPPVPEMRPAPHPLPASFPSASDETAQVSAASVTLPPAPRRTHAESWARLQDDLTHFHPFSDDELTECLRLNPEDLPMLRREGFLADSSQFLLHGFHTYHHLLLCRNRDQKESYVLGIPGVYTANEQFMAHLFGYYRFKHANRPSEFAPTERYGYWCRTLPVR